jgi:glycerol-3-phosphate acyltransferase PlsY
MSTWLIAILIGYSFGSFPTALMISRYKQGLDNRELGDGNMGARNTKRQLAGRLG